MPGKEASALIIFVISFSRCNHSADAAPKQEDTVSNGPSPPSNSEKGEGAWGLRGEHGASVLGDKRGPGRLAPSPPPRPQVLGRNPMGAGSSQPGHSLRSLGSAPQGAPLPSPPCVGV